MLLENYLKKYKETQEGFKKIIGLAVLMSTIIITFAIFNIILTEKNSVIEESDNIAENDEIADSLDAIISSLPSGRLNFYESIDGYQLSASEYEAVCKNTKIVSQRAMMGLSLIHI